MPSPTTLPDSVRVRRRALRSAYISLGLALAAIPLMFFALIPSMILLLVGGVGYAGSAFLLLIATDGQPYAHPEDLDEYERDRAFRAKTRALSIALTSLVSVMSALIVFPILISFFHASPETIANWALALGIATGLLAFHSSLSVFQSIARSMNKDELAEQQDAYA
ncbi:hypothetical protein [Corynebacterium lowii]|uniref:Uncharacterized protein n=1 Tax=Corynebacterium lowii TaxID=1544413 RepID=A0A0Q0Z5Q0_9CORY|nr:hypothetical protein [Corynebacterium lowii]KQB84832.1 hypothetical protein Clow_02094 [Corynebacterium lowii]MDP9851736.1 uncharacterized membrane protein (DUF485 family) [Corynebacterium lowii]